MNVMDWSTGHGVVRPRTPQETADASVSQAPERAAMQMTFAQLLIGLVAMKWITKAEGIAWLDGTLPAAVSGLIATLPVGDQFPALVRAKRPSVVQRLDGLVLALAALQGRSDEDMDQFFVTYAAV